MWRSLVAHLHGVQGVEGSNPFTPTNKTSKGVRFNHRTPFFIAELGVLYTWLEDERRLCLLSLKAGMTHAPRPVYRLPLLAPSIATTHDAGTLTAMRSRSTHRRPCSITLPNSPELMSAWVNQLTFLTAV